MQSWLPTPPQPRGRCPRLCSRCTLSSKPWVLCSDRCFGPGRCRHRDRQPCCSPTRRRSFQGFKRTDAAVLFFLPKHGRIRIFKSNCTDNLYELKVGSQPKTSKKSGPLVTNLQENESANNPRAGEGLPWCSPVSRGRRTKRSCARSPDLWKR